MQGEIEQLRQTLKKCDNQIADLIHQLKTIDEQGDITFEQVERLRDIIKRYPLKP